MGGLKGLVSVAVSSGLSRAKPRFPLVPLQSALQARGGLTRAHPGAVGAAWDGQLRVKSEVPGLAFSWVSLVRSLGYPLRIDLGLQAVDCWYWTGFCLLVSSPSLWL